MAILTIPFTSIYLVAHVSGGALIHAGGGYVANTFVPAAVAEAFGVASGVLGGLGTTSAAVGSAVALPVVASVAALAVVAAGGYCYFHGIPASMEAALSTAGLGATTKQGFAVSVPQLAVALIALGGAGYLAYRFYNNFRSIRAARPMGTAPDVQSKQDAEAIVRKVFGENVWADIGSSIWSSVGDAGQAARATAQETVDRGVAVAQRLAAAASHATVVGKDSIATVAASVADVAERSTRSFASLMRRFRRTG